MGRPDRAGTDARLVADTACRSCASRSRASLLVTLLSSSCAAPRARWFAVVGGIVLGVLLVVRILDAAFLATLYRPFNPLTDWRYAGSATDLLGDSVGSGDGGARGRRGRAARRRRSSP